jgi:5-methylcytosine-specific restriction endonuclease McrA
MKSKRAKACDIPKKVKEAVWERDNHRCIICGNRSAVPNSHFIRRSQGGLGIEENIVTMCMRCHSMYDQYIDREAMESYTEQYLRNKYPGWDREKLIYKKWED